MLKGRKFIIILFLGLTGLVLLSSVLVPIQFSSKARVPYSLERTMDQFRSAKQLVKWFHPFVHTHPSELGRLTGGAIGLYSNDKQVELISEVPGKIELAVETKQLKRSYTFLISADPENRKHSIVELVVYRSVWKRWFDPAPTDELAVSSLKELEAFTNDTERFYGYKIQEEAVQDSSFLFLSATIRQDEKAGNTKLLFDSLVNYLKSENVEWKGRRIYYEQPVDSLHTTIFTGVAVPDSLRPDSSMGIGKKQLPYGNKRLTIYFDGPYRNISQAYKVLDQYRKDYSLIGYMSPFEDYLSPGYGYLPDEVVKIKICYPVINGK